MINRQRRSAFFVLYCCLATALLNLVFALTRPNGYSEQSRAPFAIPFEIANCGYATVDGFIEGRPIRFMVDTGAPTTSLDFQRTQALPIKRLEPVNPKPDNAFWKWNIKQRCELKGVTFGSARLG